MNRFSRASHVFDNTATAIEQCEMILSHLRLSDPGNIDADFLRVHAVSLLQLVGEIGRPSIPVRDRKNDNDMTYLFTGDYHSKQ